MKIQFSLFFLALALQRAAAKSPVLEQHDEGVFVPNMFNEDVVRSLAPPNTCAYTFSGSGVFCDVQLNQAQCQAAATANCSNGKFGIAKDSTLYVESGGSYATIQQLVDKGNMDFWGATGLKRGCYVLKGLTGPDGGNIFFFKTVDGSLTRPTTNDKNICFAPTPSPTAVPTSSPTASPTASPTTAPTKSPTSSPTTAAPVSPPISPPVSPPAPTPVATPVSPPVSPPVSSPTNAPTAQPTQSPTIVTTSSPTPIQAFLLYAQCEFDASGQQYCIQAMGLTEGSALQPQLCNQHTPINQYFFNDSAGRIRSYANPSMCLVSKVSDRSVYLGSCDNSSGSGEALSIISGSVAVGLTLSTNDGSVAAVNINVDGGYVMGLSNENLFGNFALFKTPEELDECCVTIETLEADTSSIPAPSPLSPSKAPTRAPTTPNDNSCSDIDGFTFPLDRVVDGYGSCAWLNKTNSKARKARYCDRGHVKGACPQTCNACGATDDSTFTFELENVKGKMVGCGWIAGNSARMSTRRSRYCFASDCESASESIGNACLESCGFTVGEHAGRTCPPTPAPVAPTPVSTPSSKGSSSRKSNGTDDITEVSSVSNIIMSSSKGKGSRKFRVRK